MSIKKPRGTRDIYGLELLNTKEICSRIRKLFSAYGYSEIQTPIFEHVEVFESNDEAFLSSNKELFEIKNKNEGESKYVLRPENTASIVRAALENKIINKQIHHPIGLFYEGPYFRYERPQHGRFRQFMQMGVEKLNSDSIEDDLWNILMIQELQNVFHLKLTLKINYLGDEGSKSIWNEKLKLFFRKHEDQLSGDSRHRLNGNAFRILDDKEDSKKEFVKFAPKLKDFLREKDKSNVEKIKKFLSEFNVEYEWDEKLVRGIDYYTGLVYEWIDEVSGITIIAGGRYDQLFERFKSPSVPSLGLAIGIDRLKMVIERDKLYEWQNKRKYLYLFPKEEASLHYLNWANWIRRQIIRENLDIVCVVSNVYLNMDKHQKLASKYASSPEDQIIVIEGGNMDLSEEERNKEFLEIKEKFMDGNLFKNKE